MTAAATPAAGARRRPSVPSWIGTVPFFGYVALFLLLPTGIVVWDAFKNPAGHFTLSGLTALGNMFLELYADCSGYPIDFIIRDVVALRHDDPSG